MKNLLRIVLFAFLLGRRGSDDLPWQDKEAAEALAREAQAASDQHKKVLTERLAWFKCITALWFKCITALQR